MFAYLSEDKSCDVSGFPVGGVKEVWQSHSGEGGQNVGAVQGVIQPLGAPPAAGNWRHGHTNTVTRKCEVKAVKTGEPARNLSEEL